MDTETETDESPTNAITRRGDAEAESLSGKDADYQEETRCGLGPCNFDWLQRFASKKAYVVMYGLVGMSHLAITSYFRGTISTLEKEFQIPSSFIGLIGSAGDIGLILTTLSVTYLGKRSHKTRWVAYGTYLVVLSCFIRLIPYWLYGGGQSTIDYSKSELTTQKNNITHLCGKSFKEPENCEDASSGSVSAYIFLIANFVQGFGCSIYYTLGMAYLDDNAKKSKGAVMIVLSLVLTMFGSTIGFLLASFSLKFYIDPGVTPDFGTTDPRWIGAWWLGWGPLGVMTLVFAIMMSMFPRTLPRALQRKMKAAVAAGRSYVPEEIPKPSLEDFWKTMKRLFKNKILMCNNLSTTFIIFGYDGQMLFLPKYMETQFNISATASNLATGSIGLLCTAAGLLVSAFFIFKFKPRARYLAAWNVFTEMMDVVGFLSILMISCESLNFQWSTLPDGGKTIDMPCNSNCACDSSIKYSPVCHVSSRETFFSPCHAGCQDSFFSQNGTKVFSDCSCTADNGPVLDGPCPLDCRSAFIIFIVVQCVQRFLGATGRAGNCLIQFRCVDVADKAVAFALLEVLLCIFVFIPGPILYGHLIDMTCTLWGMTCGKTGNCWIYDADKLRYYVYMPIFGCLFIGTLWDIGVWYYVKDLQMYDDDEPTKDFELKDSKARDKKSRFKALAIAFGGN
ncbi:solute carrier organic anion transporter family member 74D-like [Cloeon dipterum]|uniref:solute carrier organic anion transporter family member 74D-like n=1 Tax=Cloeon dipterum TaxID=197152 RepID=UPI00321F97B7